MLQLHLSDQQFYYLLRCGLYKRFDGIFCILHWNGNVCPHTDEILVVGCYFNNLRTSDDECFVNMGTFPLQYIQRFITQNCLMMPLNINTFDINWIVTVNTLNSQLTHWGMNKNGILILLEILFYYKFIVLVPDCGPVIPLLKHKSYLIISLALIPKVSLSWYGDTVRSEAPFINIGLTLIPEWISHYIHYKWMWGEITFPFPNFNSAAEVWEWKGNFSPHFNRHVITYPHRDSG